MPYANNKDADQLVHPHSLISVFIIRCLDSITPIDVISEISGLYLASVAEQSGLSFSYVSQNKSSLSVSTELSEGASQNMSISGETTR